MFIRDICRFAKPTEGRFTQRTVHLITTYLYSLQLIFFGNNNKKPDIFSTLTVQFGQKDISYFFIAY